MKSASRRPVLALAGAALLGAIVLAGCEPKPPKPKASLNKTSTAETTVSRGVRALPGAGPMEPEAAWSPLGIQVREVPDAARRALGVEHGVMVVRLRPPASRTRLLPGDVIVGVNLASFRGIQEFNRLVDEAQRGAVALLVRRSDADLYITLEASEQAGQELRREGSGDAARGAGPGAPWPRRPATGRPLRT